MNPTRLVRWSGRDPAPNHDHSSGQVDGVDIVASDLFCLYPLPGGGTVAALRGMALRVPAGERLVVHGPNGSGKTTLLRVLIGEVAPSAGSVSVAGTELAGASRARLTALRRDVLGLVDQHSGRALRAELSVLDNVALQLRLAGRRRAEARARAADVLGSLGLESLAGRRTSSLSAGEAQRVAVCAAVVHAPRIVLADEPTGELDVDSADAVYALLRRASEQAGTTLLLVTHDARAAAVGDRIVRIRDGRLSEQWRPGESAAGERLVVDARGWVRLPEGLRRAAGLGESVRAQSVESFGAQPGPSADGIVLAADPGSGPPVAPTQPAALPGPLHPLEATGAVAELRDVHLAYPGRTVLDGRTIEIAPAALTVLRGRSGAGKSTLLRLLLGLADPDRGQVRLGGVDLAGLDRAGRAKLRRDLVGVATQNGALAETLDARENLALARSAGGLDADADADPSAIDAVIDALDLTAVAGRQVRLLSGGERQRVAIARALVVRRPLVVLDEPTSQQDEAHAEFVTRVLVQLAEAGTAVLCATHDPVLGDAAAVRMELT